ncbi:MAG: hypothetical protein JNL87_13815 [Burkholderiaceae bacterium]|nr:hypothetical protein [Burkholderiaceae bacterium]
MKPLEHQTDAELLDSLRRARDELSDAPAQAIERAIALWPAPVPVSVEALADAAAAALRLVQAVLSFDSRAGGPLALGLRGAAPDTLHQLVFTAEGRDIDLRIEAGPAGYEIAGQLLGPDEPGNVLLAPEAGGEPLRVAIDEFGEFRFTPVDAGRYRLTLQTGGLAIELPVVEAGPRR